MEEKPEVLSSPEMQTENPAKNDKNKTKLIIVGLVVVLLVFIGLVILLSKPTESPPPPVTTTSNEIKSESDLDRVSQELDNENLDGYDQELNQNDQDSAGY